MMTTDKKAELTRITAREGGASLVFSITVTDQAVKKNKKQKTLKRLLKS